MTNQLKRKRKDTVVWITVIIGIRQLWSRLWYRLINATDVIAMMELTISIHDPSHLQSRFMTNSGRAIGLSLGCLLGMFPLLFYNNEEKKEPKDPDAKWAEYGSRPGYGSCVSFVIVDSRCNLLDTYLFVLLIRGVFGLCEYGIHSESPPLHLSLISLSYSLTLDQEHWITYLHRITTVFVYTRLR